ncbi:MAG: hypothetical protein DRP12_00185 [Candidatus Aenigmatarchaeota archaeon]|nr:MAG: hypothetical protein DRP12_00185 [Candidatus Aenigmarchaeota archaeon]
MALTREDEEFLKRIWSEWKRARIKTGMTFLELRTLFDQFKRLCDEYYIDYKTVDFRAIIDPALSYAENLTRIKEEITGEYPPGAEFEELRFYKERVASLERELEKLKESKVTPAELNKVKRELEKTKKELERAREEAKRKSEDYKLTIRLLREALSVAEKRIEELEKALAEARARPPAPPTPPPTAPPTIAEIPEELKPVQMREPKIVIKIDPETGKPFKTLDDETMITLASLFGGPVESYLVSDETRLKKYGLLPLVKYLKIPYKIERLAQWKRIPVEYVPWLKRVVRKLIQIEKEKERE